jgi:outer membrane autotransporter protein
MAKSKRSGQPLAGKQSFKRRHIHCAVLLALGPTLALQAGAQSYINYDGSKTSDLNAAVATWATNAEFKSDWGLGTMNAQYAYAMGFSGQGVKLGSVDSGYLVTHQEFANRGVTALTATGTYLNDGSQNDGGGLTWKAGNKFSTPGSFNKAADLANHIGKNDNHGNHVSGTIAAGKNGVGMMGVSFDSQYFIANSNGTDGSIYGSNMDYNYFKAAYGNLAAAGVRAINSSWGSPVSTDDFGTVAGLTAAYSGLQSAGAKKSWLDAAAEVSQQTGVLQVFAAGNTSKANVNIRSALPYFRPELEKYWVTVVALKQSGVSVALDTSYSNRCGIAKYWCIAAPGSNINSASIASDSAYASSSGTSMAAPHVTGALGVLMARYPSLDNEAVRTILLTTAQHLGDGPVDAPNTTYGWGIPDLNKGMYGPGQFLGTFKAELAAGISDTWSNSISEAGLMQRKKDEAAEIAAWASLPSQLQPVPAAAAPSSELVAAIPQGKALLKAAITANVQGVYTAAKFNAALAAVKADPVGKVLLQLYETYKPGWTGPYSLPTDFDNFIAGRSDVALAQDTTSPARAALIASNASIQSQIDKGMPPRVSYLQTQTDADYVGSLVKTGPGTLTLTGTNTYSGGTQLQGGTLGVGNSSALGTGVLAMSDATTLQAAAQDLKLANAITVSGIGNIDTQAFGLTLSGAIADGATPGGLAKLGAGTLTLSGANSYSGPTGVITGKLQAGSATGFSPRSAFFVAANGQLDLGNFNQTIGSLAGSGKVSLGTATLATGADNSASTFSGQISGSGALAKTGSGTFTLASANTYEGGTLLKAGQLNVGDSGALGSGALSMDDGTTLGFATDRLDLANNVALTGTQDPVIDTGAFTETLSGVISGTGFLTKEGSGTLITKGANTYSGATVVATGKLLAGAVNTFSPASAITVNTGAMLDLAGYNQRIAGMTLGGTVSLAGAVPGTTLTVTGPWTGRGGLLKLGTVSSGASDRVLLSGAAAVASGTTMVQIANVVGLGAPTAGKGMEVVGTREGASIQGNAFVLVGGHVDGGAYEYHLNNVGGGSYLSSATPSGQSYYRGEVSLLAALPAQLRQGNLAMLGNMRLRVGDDDVKRAAVDANTNAPSGGDRRAWGRVITTDLDIQQTGEVSPHSKGRLSGFQAGTDLLAMPNWRAGLYVGQLDGNVRASGSAGGVANQRVGANDLRSQYLGAYGTYTSDDGFYADTVLQAGRHRYTVQPLSNGGAAGKGSSLLASIEAGQSFALGADGWRIEPQLQLVHQRMSLDDAMLPGVRVQQHAGNGWIVRAGVRVKGEVAMGVGTLQPYGRFNVYKSSKGADIARFVNPAATTSISSATGSTSTELAGGFTLALDATTSLYGEVGKLWSSGGDAKVKSGINASAGVRVRW